MALVLYDIKKYHDKWFSANQTTRRRVASEMMFFHLTHWDSLRIQGTNLAFRGEFDKLKKAGNRIMSVLRANPVQVDFQAVSDKSEDEEELIDGLYRRDTRKNNSIEAFNNAKSECIVGGVGAWHVFTKYEQRLGASKNQIIEREPVYESNNNLLWDDNARLKDKSDSIGASLLSAYSQDGYRKLVKDLTGRDEDVNPTSFAFPEESFTFPWVSGENEIYYVSTFYFKEKVKDKILTLQDQDGSNLCYLESKVKEMIDELAGDGYQVVDSKPVDRFEVTQYIVSGKEIIHQTVISGSNIPFVPMYANRAYIEGQEHYEGITKVAKDPQILHDFQMSYLADIVSRSPRPKPLLYAEQVLGLEKYWNIAGADDNHAYRLINRIAAADGKELPLSVGTLPDQQVPQSLILSLEAVRGAIADALPPDIPKDLAETDLSGKALQEVNRMISDQAFLYQESYKHALRRDAEICASIYSDILDSPRQLKVTLPDGTPKSVEYMEDVLSEETGDMEVKCDLTNMEFEVFAEIGQSYTTQQEETFDKLGKMAAEIDVSDPDMAKSLRLQQLTLMDGAQLKSVRKNARRTLVLSGFEDAETDEEKALLEQVKNQPPQPDPAMAMAQAEQAKAEANMQENQVTAQRDQFKAQNEIAQTEIDRFNAETARYEVQVNAEEAGATIAFKNDELVVKQNENLLRFRAAVNQR